MANAPVELIHFGDWGEADVHTLWNECSTWKPADARIAHDIDDAWERARLGPSGEHLFDGPMCRLESHAADAKSLHLTLSPTSYRIFLGTNLRCPELAGTLGPGVLANPVGVSAVVMTRDEQILLGRRSKRVAYYPERIHPFAGTLEPPVAPSKEVDVFQNIRRELFEELSLTPGEMTRLRCIGLVRDARLCQPELIFEAHCARSCAELDAGLDPVEHEGSIAIDLYEPSLAAALEEPFMTPVALAALLLLGRRAFGEAWFARASRGRIVRS